MNLYNHQRRALALIRERVCLENARIGFSEEQLAAMNDRGRYLGDDTDEIREALRLHRETWILPLIDALLRGENPFNSWDSESAEATAALERFEEALRDCTD